MSLAPIPPVSPEELTRLIALADRVAADAHAGQTRKGNGVPYITHPRAVADRVLPHLKPIALLHDVIEDTDITAESLNAFPDWIVDRVILLSRLGGMNYSDFILRAGQDIGTRRVKQADLAHNLSDIKEGSLADKYRLALVVLDMFDATDDLSHVAAFQRLRLAAQKEGPRTSEGL